MTLSTSLPRIEEHRVPVVFDCPSCHAAAVRGTAYDLRETIRVADRVPSWGWSSHWVRCSECGAELHANCKSKSLQGASPDAVNKSVHAYLPFTKRFLAIASIMLGWAPGVGLVLGMISLAANARTRGWPRAMSIVGLALAGVITASAVACIIYFNMEAARPPSIR